MQTGIQTCPCENGEPRNMDSCFRRNDQKETKLLPEQRKQQRQDNADDKGGSDREVKSELLFFDDDVTGELTDPRNLLANQEKDADGDDKNAKEDEDFP